MFTSFPQLFAIYMWLWLWWCWNTITIKKKKEKKENDQNNIPIQRTKSGVVCVCMCISLLHYSPRTRQPLMSDSFLTLPGILSQTPRFTDFYSLLLPKHSWTWRPAAPHSCAHEIGGNIWAQQPSASLSSTCQAEQEQPPHISGTALPPSAISLRGRKKKHHPLNPSGFSLKPCSEAVALRNRNKNGFNFLFHIILIKTNVNIF